MMLFQWRKARETYEEAISMWREYKEKEVCIYIYSNKCCVLVSTVLISYTVRDI